MKLITMSVALACISSLLTACATPFPVDANAPEAKIAVNDYRIFQNNNLSVIFSDYKNCSSGPAAIIPSKAAMPINVKHPATLFINHTVGYTNYRFTATFQPKANHIYLIDTRSTKLSAVKMKVTLRILDNTNANEPILFAPRKNNLGMLTATMCSSDDFNYAEAHKTKQIEQSRYVVPIYFLAEKLTN